MRNRMAVLCAALFAVLAFGAVVAASASATDEWLVGGKLIGLSEKISVVEEVRWLWRLLNSLGSYHVMCSYKVIGTLNGLNPSGRGTDTVTAFEGLKGEKGTYNCEILHAELGLCSGSLLVLVKALNLPWLTELILPTGAKKPEDAVTSTIAGREPGFAVECELSNKTIATEECEGKDTSNELVDESNGTVDGSIPETEDTKCKGFGDTLHILFSWVLKTLSGAPIAVS
jgi:hypothetical protein